MMYTRASLRSGDWGYLQAATLTAICTLLAYPLSRRLAAVNVVMVYLLGTTLGALRLRRGPSALAALLNVLAFDFFYVPPLFSFDVEDVEYVVTLAVMLVVALVIAELMLRIRHHTEIAGARERRTAVLYAMSRELAVAADAQRMAGVAVRHLREVFNSAAAVFVSDAIGELTLLETPYLDYATPSVDAHIARQAAEGGGERSSGWDIYVPLQAALRVMGVLVVSPDRASGGFVAEERQLLDALAAQLALSLERALLADAAEAAHLAAERAALRNTLLTSISHDLRTPLAAIAGAGGLIAQSDHSLHPDRRVTLGRLIEQKARDMSQLLSKVLDLMRLEFGTGPLRPEWHSVDDLVSLALRNNEVRLAERRLALDLPADLPMILVEATLIVQILGNLIENAGKHTPPGTTIKVSARVQSHARPATVIVVVEDNGPGFPPGDPERLFDKFQRGRPESDVIGVGLGLAICRAAVRMHGGEIRALKSPLGGARFEIALPVATAVGVPA
jgi:two-component system sensor histidine kinase KdpD